MEQSFSEEDLELSDKLDSLKKDILVAKEELKILTIKRFECIDFFNELKYRESNLKRKYEAIGLIYE